MANSDIYNAASLRQVLDGLEKRYGMTSAEFTAARAADNGERLAPVPGFTRHAWADIYDEWQSLGARAGDDFAEHVERELALTC